MFGARFAVFVRQAHVLPSPCPATRNLSFLRCFTGTVTLLFQLVVHWDSTGWRENSTRWKSCKPVRTRGRGAWASLAHNLQCLCGGRACLLALALQLVICRSGGFTGAVTLLFQLVVSLEMVRVGVKIPQDGNRANVYGHVAVVHGHVWRTLCSVCATGARVARPVPRNS